MGHSSHETGHVIQCFPHLLSFYLPNTTQLIVGDQMKLFLSIFLLSTALAAQSFLAPGSSALPDAPSQRPFWPVEKRVKEGTLAGRVPPAPSTPRAGLTKGLRKS